jgi:hypothetical protein
MVPESLTSFFFFEKKNPVNSPTLVSLSGIDEAIHMYALSPAS